MEILEKINLGLDCCVGGIGCSKRCPYHGVSPDDSLCKEAILKDVYACLNTGLIKEVPKNDER